MFVCLCRLALVSYMPIGVDNQIETPPIFDAPCCRSFHTKVAGSSPPLPYCSVTLTYRGDKNLKGEAIRGRLGLPYSILPQRR